MCHRCVTWDDVTLKIFYSMCHEKTIKCFVMSSLAKRVKAANLDAIHDTVHEMARDEARHGKAFEGLLKRNFG